MIFQLTGINLVFVLSAVYGLGIFTCWLYVRAHRRTNTAEDPTLQPIKALLDSIDDLAWIKDSESRFVLVNRKFGEVFGVEPAQLIGKSDADLSSPELAERYQMDDCEVMRSKMPSRIVEQIARPNGAIGWSETLKVPVFDCDGNTVGTAGVARDVTERHQAHTVLEQRVSERTQEISTTLETLKRTQDELIQREKVAALGDLVAGIAHELNTPIGNSLTVASTLHDQARDFHEQIATKLTRSGLDHFIRTIQDGSDILVRSLHKAAELVNSFKQVAVDQTSVNRRTFDLCELVEEVLLTHGPTFRKTPHSIKHTIAQGIALDSYPGPLGQVITNLVHNALIHGLDDACPGNVVITGYMAGENHIVITVKDDGRGIAADILPRIFDPFFTTRLGKGGSGLGLNIVHSLVIGVLGGSIAASSDGPGGALFTAKIPTVAPLHPTVVI